MLLLLSLLISSVLSAQDMHVWIEHKGQLSHPDGSPASEVLCYAQLSGLDIYLTPEGLSYVIKDRKKKEEDEKEEGEDERRREAKLLERRVRVPYHRVDLLLPDARIDLSNAIFEQRNQGLLNFYDVPGHPEGIRNVREFTRIVLRDVYPGIDWALFFKWDNSPLPPFKHEFIVHPGTDPSLIKMKIAGAPFTADDGRIMVKTSLGNLDLGNLVCLQNDRPLKASYKTSNQTIVHHIPDYNKSQDLIIDPELIWSTYYGGSYLDGPEAAAIDIHGNQYVTGYTTAVAGDFPLQPGPGYYDAAGSRGFLLKFNAGGGRLYATFYSMLARDIDIDSNQNILIVGYADAGNPALFQSRPGAYNQNTGVGFEGIIAMFDSIGNRLWCTAFGGGGEDRIYSCAFDHNQHMYITGFTTSSNFPQQALPGAYHQSTGLGNKDLFIARFDAQGALVWSTRLGGGGIEEAFDVRVDYLNRPHLVGYTFSQNYPLQAPPGSFLDNTLAPGHSKGFITRFDANGILEWSTLFGSSGAPFEYDPNQVADIGFDRKNNVYVIGKVHGTDLPVKPMGTAYYKPVRSGDYDMFIARFSPQGAQLWTTYFGGSGTEIAMAGGTSESAIAFDCNDQLYIAGSIMEDPADIFPRLPSPEPNSYFLGAYTPGNLPDRPRDAFITRFDTSGAINWSTLIASEGYDLIRDMVIRHNVLLLVGEHTSSGGLITGQPGSYQQSYTGMGQGWFDDGTIKSFLLTPPNAVAHNLRACEFPFLLDATEPGTLSYLWSDGSKGPAFPAPAPGTYFVQKHTARGCTTVDTFHVTSAPAPQTPLLADEYFEVCEGDTLTIAALETPGAAYTWQDGITGPVRSIAQPGTYIVTAQLGDCIVHDSLTLAFAQSPVVFLGADTLICNGDKITLQVPGAHHIWQDGSTLAAYVVTSAGLYWVEVTDNFGCKGADSIRVEETDCSVPFLPSAFTPNGDGLNDVLQFIASGEEYKLIQFSVYNRWGTLVFYSDNIQKGWNGTYKGKPCEMGTYYYTWELSSSRTGRRISGKGDVTLIR